ncbi:hypothetical protein A8A54_15420 [Brucella pseudogrignonensis]|uniref:DUF4062 domain-containing protein n=1 Tax=Brucella pseudogrignonensis TaxID=419475 RepID=UPI0007DAB174|nr:DUF4062 domain-containing protein [Brucella pseudogrignonensis]ANG97749.1 hypothetical protein A8A54_15420 [Brucella pseudogrignonensis]
MKSNRTIIKVFLASPGDLKEERTTAKRVVDEENRNHAYSRGYQIELVGWEDTVAQDGRAQEVINRDLDQCDYFIGLLWKRWGTPPGPEGSEFTSGFQEEYERAQSRFKQTTKPGISMLFKEIAREEEQDPGPQLEKVIAFKQDFTSKFRGLYQSFSGLADFEQKVRSIIAMFLKREIELDQSNQTDDKSLLKNSSADSNLENAKGKNSLFSHEVQTFLYKFIDNRNDSQSFDYSPTDVARFRLLSHSLQLSQNDIETIGAHDANLIFRDIRDADLSDRERRGLLRAGVRYYQTRSAPLFHWLYKQDTVASTALALATLSGPDEAKKNAFVVLGLIDEQLNQLPNNLERGVLVDHWLKNSDPDRLVSAINYLAICGLKVDLERIEALISSPQATVSQAAVIAKIQILLRESTNDALNFIATREDSEISTKLASKLLANLSTIETSILLRCLNNRSFAFRKIVASELLKRNAISTSEAKVLIESDSAEIRAIGARALKLALAEYSLDDARIAIVRPSKGIGLYYSGYDEDGEIQFSLYKHDILCEKDYNDLIEMQKSENIYSTDASLALYDKYFKKTRNELVANINDDFKVFIRTRIDKMPGNLFNPKKEVEDFIRNKIFLRSMNILCSKKIGEDIDLIRKKIDENEIPFSKEILIYLEKFGDWEDVNRIIKLSQTYGRTRLSLMFDDNKNELRLSARLLLKLARNRIADLLKKDMSVVLQKEIFKLFSKSQLKSFDDSKIESWLNIDNDEVRQVIALKCVSYFPRARIQSILNSYIIDGKSYFYNVIFWLDLGLSSNKATSLRIAEKMLDDEF